MRHRRESFRLFPRFLAGFLIVGQLTWNLPPVYSDALRPTLEGNAESGLEERKATASEIGEKWGRYGRLARARRLR